MVSWIQNWLPTKTSGPPSILIDKSTCSGCSVSALNANCSTKICCIFNAWWFVFDVSFRTKAIMHSYVFDDRTLREPVCNDDTCGICSACFTR